jgi:hypothetical protein
MMNMTDHLTSKEIVESLMRFAQHAPLCLISQWQPTDPEDFDCPDCTCGLTLLEQHGRQLAARLAVEPSQRAPEVCGCPYANCTCPEGSESEKR